MAGSGVSPTARRFELARRLKELREDAGQTLEDIAVVLACSVTKVSRIESAQRLPSQLDVKVLGEHFGLSGQQRAALQQLVSDARKRGWWFDFRGLDEQARTYVGLESAASNIREVEVTRIPGLLQTDAYVEWLMPRLSQPRGMSAEELGEQIAVRRLRRKRLIDGTLQAHFILDEGTLSRRIGPPELMLGQVRQLLEFAQLDNVTLQVITFDVGSHPALNEGFTILDFSEGESARTVVLEGLAGVYLLRAVDRHDLVQNFVDTFQVLNSPRMALSPTESLAWLAQLESRIDTRIDIRDMDSQPRFTN